MRQSKRKTGFGQRLGWVLSLVGMVTSGCQSVEDCSLTYRVWNGELGHRRLSMPAPEPRLALFEAPSASDILVQYDSLNEVGGKIRRRAYWLQKNQPKILNGKKPDFVNPAIAAGLEAIPVLSRNNDATNQAAPAVASEPSPAGLHAELMPDKGQFSLFLEDRAETYRLPIYNQKSGVALQVALTPLAVLGDTVMVAGVAALVVAVAWAESRGSYSCR